MSGKNINKQDKNNAGSLDPILYPPAEDIYNRAEKLQGVDPEDIETVKQIIVQGKGGEDNHKNFEQDVSGEDLDIPGAELDDDQENIGNEDEENNYYSLGGDNHNDLEEDKGA